MQDQAHNQDPQDQNDDLQAKLDAAAKQAAEKDQAEAEQISETDTLKKQLAEMTEMAKRTMADIQNLKRRQEEERKVIITMANMDLIRSLIPHLDNVDRAIAHTPEGTDPNWFQGLEMSLKQIHATLEAQGVKPMETINQPFNPDLHEAVAQGPGPKDQVIAEMEKGYMLGEKVLRHAKVQVGNGEQ